MSADTTSVVLNGQALSIRSTLQSSVRGVSAMAGYTRPVSGWFHLDGFAGLSFTHARRRFTTNAASQLLLPPSSVSDSSVDIIDNAVTWIAGADGRFGRRGPFNLVAGVRVQPLRLESDLDGWATRLVGGVEWRLR
jgi:hypothetical protein